MCDAFEQLHCDVGDGACSWTDWSSVPAFPESSVATILVCPLLPLYTAKHLLVRRPWLASLILWDVHRLLLFFVFSSWRGPARRGDRRHSTSAPIWHMRLFQLTLDLLHRPLSSVPGGTPGDPFAHTVFVRLTSPGRRAPVRLLLHGVQERQSWEGGQSRSILAVLLIWTLSLPMALLLATKTLFAQSSTGIFRRPVAVCGSRRLTRWLSWLPRTLSTVKSCCARGGKSTVLSCCLVEFPGLCPSTLALLVHGDERIHCLCLAENHPLRSVQSSWRPPFHQD